MELWNQKHLEPPPINSCKTSIKEIDMKLLRIAVKDGLSFFQNQRHLHTEATLLSRTVYRMKTKMRASKDFKMIEKLNRVLRSYLQINMTTLLKTLSGSIPEYYRVNRTNVLTKNMLDYVLVRLQGLGKVLSRILETCKIAFMLTQQKLKLGHFWKLTVILYATTARIFVVVQNILKFTCQLYDDLVAFSANLGNTGVRWLPEDYVFPDKLDKWLNVDWLDLEKNIIEIPDEESSFIRFMDDSDDDVEFCDEYVLVRDDFSVCDITEEADQSVQVCDDENGDGEIINISDADTPIKQSQKKKRKRKFVETSGETVPSLFNLFNNDDDVGEVINISDSETPLKGKQKRRKLNKSGEVISISHGETPKKKQKLKKLKKTGFISSNNSTDIRKATPNKKINRRKSKKKFETPQQKRSPKKNKLKLKHKVNLKFRST